MDRPRAGLAAVLVAVALPASATAKLSETASAHAVFTLDPDGVMEVLEQAQVRADGATRSVWQVTMQRGELFAQPAVVVDDRRYRPGDGRRAGSFRISRGTRGIRFDWLQPRGAGSFRLGYRLALFGTAYTDVVDLRVPIWERDWPVPVRVLTAALKLPRVPRGRVIVWVEPRSVAASVTTAGDQIRVQARQVPAGTSVTLHAVFPRTVLTSFDGVNVQRRPGLPSILAARHDSDPAWWPWALAAGLALALALSAVALRTGRLRLPLRR